MTDDRIAKIRTLNDRFRHTGVGGTIIHTDGIHDLGPEIMKQVVHEVIMFDDFTNDNDPYGEHDFGSLIIEGEKIFWKIDYYGLDMMSGSNDPSNPDITKRVLTIMLAQEY